MVRRLKSEHLFSHHCGIEREKEMYTALINLSLSLSIYIYIYIYLALYGVNLCLETVRNRWLMCGSSFFFFCNNDIQWCVSSLKCCF